MSGEYPDLLETAFGPERIPLAIALWLATQEIIAGADDAAAAREGLGNVAMEFAGVQFGILLGHQLFNFSELADIMEEMRERFALGVDVGLGLARDGYPLEGAPGAMGEPT